MMLALKAAAEPFGGKRKIQVQLPVNMRRFYPSKTLRNFSMYCSIRLHPSRITTLDDILPEIARQVTAGTAKESLDGTMTLSRKLVKYLRVVPLIVKRPIAYLLYGRLSDGVFTTTFSNLGVVTLPEKRGPLWKSSISCWACPCATARSARCAATASMRCSPSSRTPSCPCLNTPFTRLSATLGFRPPWRAPPERGRERRRFNALSAHAGQGDLPAAFAPQLLAAQPHRAGALVFGGAAYLCLLVNLLTGGTAWSLAAVGGLAVAWITFFYKPLVENTVIKKMKDYRFRGVPVSVFAGLAFGGGWSGLVTPSVLCRSDHRGHVFPGFFQKEKTQLLAAVRVE
jgi:hypothetical protein